MTYYLFLFLISLLISYVITTNSTKIADELKIFDIPKKNSIHSKLIPKTGGLIIFLILIINYLILIFAQNELIDNTIQIICLSLIFFTGLIDDSKNLNPWLRIILIILISLILISSNNEIYVIKELIFHNFWDESLYLKDYSYVFTIFCILVFYNAYNFIDGIDGLAIAVAIVWILMIPLSIRENILIFSSLIVILFFNLQNKIFLGNSGTSILSFFIGMNYIKYYNVSKFLYADQILIFFLIPGLDLIRLFITRLMKKRSPFQGDLDHLHHLMFQYFYSSKKALLSYLLLLISPIILSIFTAIKSLYIVISFTIFYFLLLIFLKKKLFKNST